MAVRNMDSTYERVAAPFRRVGLQRAGVQVGSGVRILGAPVVSLATGSFVLVGARSTLISRSRWTALGVSRPVILRTLLTGATIDIGSDVGMSGTTVCAARSVVVGDRVLLGSDVVIADTDFHPVDALPRRHCSIPEPIAGEEVIIERDAFIGARSIILKGARVGRGAVVGAGSVVAGDVPPCAVVAGAPARFIRWVNLADHDDDRGIG